MSLLAWLTILGTCSGATAAPALPELTVGRGNAPAIDGTLDDPAWARAAVATDFRLLGQGTPATQATEVRLFFDDTSLYLGFTCHEAKMDEVQGTVTQRDGTVYEDDAVEVFLSPHPGGIPYYHFVVNLLGTQREDVGADPEWNAEWTVRTSRRADGWCAEVAIPWSALDIPGDVPERWSFNLARTERPHGELSTWSPCQSGFHEPQNFGRLRWEGMDFRPFARATLRRQRDRLQAEAQEALRDLDLTADSPLARRLRRQRDELQGELSEADRRIEAAEAPAAELAAAQEGLRRAQEALTALQSLAQRQAMAQAVGRPDAGFALCRESTLTKVLPDRPYRGQPITETQVFLAKNEYEGLQLVVVPLGQALEQVRVTAGRFTGPQGAVLAPENVALNVVGYVSITQPSGGARMGTGRFPDPLLPNAPFDVPESAVQSLWITFYAPPDAAAGDYHGTITVAPANAPPQQVQVTLTVWDFALPKASFLRNDFQINRSYVARYSKVPASPHVPLGWTYSVWSGADIQGRENYFGRGVFENRVEAEEPHSAPRAYRITGLTLEPGTHERPRACFYTEPIPLEPHTDYVLSLWYRTAGTEPQIAGGLYPPFGGMRLENAGDWTRWEARFNSGEQTEIRIYVGCYARGTVWYDDVSLKKANVPNAPELLPNPGFDQGSDRTLADVLRAYRLNALRHRANDQDIAAPDITVDGQTGQVTIDWTEFDQEVQFYLDHGLNAFNISWARLPGGWGTVAEADETQKRIARAILSQTQAHLEEKGWTDLAYIYVIDEPGAAFFPQVKAAFDLVREAAPKLKTLLTFGYGATRPWQPGRDDVEAAYADLTEHVDIFVPHIDCVDWKVLDRVRGQDNNEIWEYVCISAQRPYPNIWGIDYPGIDHRIVYWQLFRYGFQGFLYWNITYWAENPWRNPLTYPGGNGDGSLLYPGEEGPVDSIRWEITRDGIEDYDLLCLLRQRLAEVQDPGLRARLQQALDVTDIAATFTDYEADPAVLEARRVALGQLLEEARSGR